MGSGRRRTSGACSAAPGPALTLGSYAAALTEMVLLGVVAFRTGRRIEWDGPNMRSTNCSEAEQYLKPEYRRGWSL